jgi:hypothetical protein
MSYEATNEITVKKMTSKAALIWLEDQDRDVWVPLSVIHEDDLAELCEGWVGEINVKSWFYEREIEVE